MVHGHQRGSGVCGVCEGALDPRGGGLLEPSLLVTGDGRVAHQDGQAIDAVRGVDRPIVVGLAEQFRPQCSADVVVAGAEQHGIGRVEQLAGFPVRGRVAAVCDVAGDEERVGRGGQGAQVRGGAFDTFRGAWRAV